METAAKDDAGETNPSVQAFYGLFKEKNKPLLALYVMVFLEVGGFAMCIPVINFFAIKELGLSPSEVGFVLSANSATQFLGSWLCGRLSDSWGRRGLLLFSFAHSGICIGLTAIVHNFWQLLALRTIQGLSGGTTPLSQSYILDWISKADRPAYLGLFGFCIGVAFLCGNVLGLGLIWLELGRRNIFLVASAFCMMATVYGCFTVAESLPERKRRPLWRSTTAELQSSRCFGPETPTPSTAKTGALAPSPSSAASPASSSAWLESSDFAVVGFGLICIWVCRFFNALGNAIMFSTYSFLIDQYFAWSDFHFGGIMATFGLAYALLQFIVYPIFGKRGKLGSAAAVAIASVCGIGAAILFPQKNIPLHFMALALASVTAAFFEPATPVLVGLFAGGRHIGFANGFATACRCAAAIAGPSIGGYLYERGIPLLYAVGGSCYVMCLCASGGIALAPEKEEPAEEEFSDSDSTPTERSALLSNSKTV
eukprot:TRINITY_DN7868_c0_g1_i1.p1 TRINITY_DN7868_c0_g1~~TRINITY_DN7868_c0_g1_i1.p1  ORF type:complete len:483 (+),score=99.71 TRINITY_DN7868_c0_g1_i1:166-1614(+)